MILPDFTVMVGSAVTPSGLVILKVTVCFANSVSLTVLFTSAIATLIVPVAVS